LVVVAAVRDQAETPILRLEAVVVAVRTHAFKT
jgi:hypothetical protein